MAKYEFDVEGMSCGHCVNRVENALKPLSSAVDVNLEANTASVESDRAVEELLGALDEAGYPGTLRA